MTRQSSKCDTFSEEGVYKVYVGRAGPADFHMIAKLFPKYIWILFESNKENIAPSVPVTGFFTV